MNAENQIDKTRLTSRPMRSMVVGALLAAGMALSTTDSLASNRVTIDRDMDKPLYIVAMIDGKKKVVIVPAGQSRATAAIDFDEWKSGKGVPANLPKAKPKSVAVKAAYSGKVDMGRLGAPRMAPFAGVIEALAKKEGVDPALVRAVIHAESAYNDKAVSPMGAGGLMQLMPATAKRFGVEDRFNLGENIRGGVAYLALLMKMFDDPKHAVAAYNAGEGAVGKYKGIPPYKETQTYVGRVMTLWSAYREQYRKS